MNSILSVIVPVYQAEKYINRCLNSILASTYRDLEVILVDDGSTDGSASLCDAWAIKNERVHVIHKENGGVSSARNEGIRKATGKYITFVDVDDYISQDTYDIALMNFTEDVCSVAFRVVICDQSGIPFHNAPTTGGTLVFDSSIKALEYYWYEGKNTAVWCRIFLRDVIRNNSILFDTATGVNEEGLFMTNYYTKCEGKVIQLNNRFYYYVQNQGSATHHITNSQVEKIMENYHMLIPLCSSLSSTCGERVKLRYTEILIRLLGNYGTRRQLEHATKLKVRCEVKQSLKAYRISKLVSKRRKYYAIAVLYIPRITSHFEKSLKIHLHKSGKSW